jgi:PleD family two-component response regulator
MRPRSLPVDAAGTQALEGELVLPVQAQARRILVADDNRDNAESLMMLLRLSGREVHVAHSGTEALEMAKRVCPEIGV